MEEEPHRSAFEHWLLIGTKFCCIISIGGLVLTALTFTIFRSLYTVRNSIHRNLCFALLGVEFIFFAGITGLEKQPEACRAGAIALHYLLLSSFLWMLLEGYLLYRMIIQVFDTSRNRVVVYYLIGYALPLVIVVPTALLAWQDYGTSRYCWINVKSWTFYSLAIPIFIIVAINTAVLIASFKVLVAVKVANLTGASRTSRLVSLFKGSVSLLSLLGITWVLGFFVAIGTGGTVLSFFFTLANCIQGGFIFALHVCLNKTVRNTVVKALESRYPLFKKFSRWFRKLYAHYRDLRREGTKTTSSTKT